MLCNQLLQMKFLRCLCSHATSTIFALSSGYGKCGVAVIRVSGPAASEALYNIAKLKSLPQPRLAVLHTFKDPITDETLDRGLLLWFPGPRSFTGEDSCELQVHGGPAVVSAMLGALDKLPGYRPAEPGEFTKRAFYAGKLDLTEVEGLADLIHAETEAQRKQAFLQMEGHLSRMYSAWRGSIVKIMANIEAHIDFSESEHIENDILHTVEENVQQLKRTIQNHLADRRCGERLREGVRAVIIGEPNVGKSSLLNALCRRPAAIVTPLAGTTRDVVESHINIGGYPVILADTAGLHDKVQDVVEKEGISRAQRYAEQADLIILVVSISRISSSGCLMDLLHQHVAELSLFSMLNRKCTEKGLEDLFADKKCVIVLNKLDLLPNPENIEKVAEQHTAVIPLSCKTEYGIHQLLDELKRQLLLLCGNPSRENPHLTQSRHRHHLVHCVQHLEDYLHLSAPGGDLVLAAECLRKSAKDIGRIIGHVSTEDILDVIFKEFCVGK